MSEGCETRRLRDEGLADNFEGESHRYEARIGENVNDVDDGFVRKRRRERRH